MQSDVTFTTQPSGIRSISMFVASGVLAVVLIGFGFALITAAASRENRSPSPLVVVDIINPQSSTGYQRVRKYIGRIEPAQQTDLGFEQGGKISEVLVDEGEIVAAGQIIARLDVRSLRAQLASQVAIRKTLESDQALNKLTLQRQRNLKKKGFAATQALDEARFSLQRTVAAIEQVNAAILSIELNIDKAILIAPFSARVGKRMVDLGAIVSAGVTVVTLFETGLPTARIGITPDVLDQLSLRDEYAVIVAGKAYTARLLSKRPDLAIQTRTVETRFALSLPSRNSPPYGEIAELDLKQAVNADGFWIPVSTLLQGDRNLWNVFSVRRVESAAGEKEFKIVRESVELLHSEGDLAYVTGQIGRDTLLVARGTHRVVAGQRVLVAKRED